MKKTPELMKKVDELSKPISEEMFDLLYALLAGSEIPFTTQWKNGTGYLDGAVFEDIDGKLSPKMARSVDDKNRRVILSSTPYGNVVLFERFTPGNGPFVAVVNAPEELRRATHLSMPPHDKDLLAMANGSLWSVCKEVVRRGGDTDSLTEAYYNSIWGIDIDDLSRVSAPYQKTIVKMGNARDTDGIDVVEAYIVKEIKRAVPLKTNPVVIMTARGFGAATITAEGYYYCTNFLPCPAYEEVAASQWGVEWSEENQEIAKDLKVIESKLRSDVDGRNVAIEAMSSVSA